MFFLIAALNAVLLHTGSLLGAVYRRRYRRRGKKGARVSEKWLLRTLRRSRNTEIGKKLGFAHLHSAKDYQEAVPLSTYDDYAPYIDRMIKNGQQRLITDKKVNFFTPTSGTGGTQKYIPQTWASLYPYFPFVCILANDLVKAMRARHVSSLTGRGFLVTEHRTKRASEVVKGARGKARIGVVSSYAMGGMGLLIPLFTPLPGAVFGDGESADLKYVKARYGIQDPTLKYFGGIYMSSLTDEIAYIEKNHDLLIHDIETGTIDPSVDMTDRMRKKLEKKLRPDPERARELREIFHTSSDVPLVSRIWKDLSYVCAIGSGDFEPFTRKMRALCNPDVQFSYSIYAASEATMGIAMGMEDKRYLLQSNLGFYEFLPIPEECDAMPERPLLMHELEVGKHYEIILTNASGLYRYRLRDVIRVAGFEGEVPYIVFAYRSTFLTDFAAIHLTGEQLAAAAEAAEKAMGVRMDDYSLYGNLEDGKPRVDLFLETDRPLSAAELSRMAQVFEEKLIEISHDYHFHKVEMGDIESAALIPVAQGTYTRYRDMRVAAGASLNQLKAIRVIKKPEDLRFFRAAAVDPEP